MSILDEVLIEEYNRCARQRACCLQELAEWQACNEGLERQAQLKEQIERIEFDQKKIRAALDVAGINIEEHLEPIHSVSLNGPKIRYEKIPEEMKQVCSKEEWDQMTEFEQRIELAEMKRSLQPDGIVLDGPGSLIPSDFYKR